MFYFSNLKNKNLLQKQSVHVYTLNFRRLPNELKSQVDDFEQVARLPYLRGPQNQRELYVNKNAPEWKDLMQIFVSLDNLPDVVLHDMYINYRQKYKNLTGDKLKTFDDSETARRTVYSLLLEVMWTHGDDGVQSILYPDI